jgi:hypothetical protein
LAWCHHMTPRGCGKILRRFRKSCDIHCVETAPYLGKDHGFQREHVSFESDAAVALSVGLEYFCRVNIHHYLIHVKIWHLSGPVCYILAIKCISRHLVNIIQI